MVTVKFKGHQFPAAHDWLLKNSKWPVTVWLAAENRYSELEVGIYGGTRNTVLKWAFEVAERDVEMFARFTSRSEAMHFKLIF